MPFGEIVTHLQTFHKRMKVKNNRLLSGKKEEREGERRGKEWKTEGGRESKKTGMGKIQPNSMGEV